MNKHIYKVIKWVEDPESVSQEERGKNKEESVVAYDPLDADFAADSAAYSAAYFAADNDSELAAIWVSKYFEETGESKQDYLEAIEQEKVGSKKEPTQEWVDGLPHVGCECLTLHKGDLVECLYVGKGIGEEYIYQVISGCHRGEIDRLIGSPRFRPLKTQEEKDREAFAAKCAEYVDMPFDEGEQLKLTDVFYKLFDAGFKAPGGE